jgi:hypothetical protein
MQFATVHSKLAHDLIRISASIQDLAEVSMNASRNDGQALKVPKRAPRWSIALPARVTWKDSHGATRFATVLTRDISESGVYIEWQESATIPLYRLVSLQIERDARTLDGVPAALRSGKVLSAVYRLGSYRKSTGTPGGYGLRLLVEPPTKAADVTQDLQASAIA